MIPIDKIIDVKLSDKYFVPSDLRHAIQASKGKAGKNGIQQAIIDSRHEIMGNNLFIHEPDKDNYSIVFKWKNGDYRKVGSNGIMKQTLANSYSTNERLSILNKTKNEHGEHIINILRRAFDRVLLNKFPENGDLYLRVLGKYQDYIDHLLANAACGKHMVDGSFAESLVAAALVADLDPNARNVISFEELSSPVQQIIECLPNSISKKQISGMYQDESGNKVMILQLSNPQCVDAVRVNAEGWVLKTPEEMANPSKYEADAKSRCDFIEIKDTASEFLRKTLPPVDDDCYIVKEDFDAWTTGLGRKTGLPEVTALTNKAKEILQKSSLNRNWKYDLTDDDKTELLNNMYNDNVKKNVREMHTADAIAFLSGDGKTLKIVPTNGFTKDIADEFIVSLSCEGRSNYEYCPEESSDKYISHFRASEQLKNALINEGFKVSNNSNDYRVYTSDPDDFTDMILTSNEGFEFKVSRTGFKAIIDIESLSLKESAKHFYQKCLPFSIDFTYKANPTSTEYEI